MIDLDTLNKEENYSVPDGYFEQFPQQMMDRIHREKAHSRNTWFSVIAAALAILICGASVIRYIQQDEISTEIISQNDAQLEEQMIDYYSSEFAQMDYLNY